MDAPRITSTSRFLMDPLDVQARRDAQARTKARHVLEHPANLDTIMDQVAEGKTLSQIAQYFGVQYRFFYSLLTKRHGEALKAARAARAEALQERNLAMADKVEDGKMEPAAAKAAAGIRNVYTERIAPETWAPKSSVDLNVRGTMSLHWEALQQVMGAEAMQDIEDAEFTPVDEAQQDPTATAPAEPTTTAPAEPPNLDDHPLL